MISCSASPLQSRPPCAGAGLLHERRRDLTATPHGCEHADQADQLVQPPWRVQLVTSAARPTHGAPPRAGAGLEHWRRRHRHGSPGPASPSAVSSWRQGCQSPQALQPPSTGRVRSGHWVTGWRHEPTPGSWPGGGVHSARASSQPQYGSMAARQAASLRYRPHRSTGRRTRPESVPRYRDACGEAERVSDKGL